MRGILRHWEPEQWSQLGVCVPLPGEGVWVQGLVWGWGRPVGVRAHRVRLPGL